MLFRTTLPSQKYPFEMHYKHAYCFVGSCFSDHLGSFFVDHQFTTLSNPFGTLFNPYSIADNLKNSIVNQGIDNQYIYSLGDHNVSFLNQGKFHHSDQNQLQLIISSIYNEVNQFLQKADYLFITWGTAYVYRFIERDIIVGNCHKIPNYQFKKERLSVEEIVSIYQDLIQSLLEINPQLKIIFTVSPVRHLSDGFHENQLSKSILHLAIDQLTDQKNSFYFPAYELIMDDLRDYRFYASDLCHIGENGVQYILEHFISTFFNEKTQQQLQKNRSIIKRTQHKPLK
jgi:hypothetical protein